MTTKELLDFHVDFTTKARNIVEKKNHDYSGASGETPFANFQVTELLGVTTTEKGFLVRILDKVMRLATFSNGGALKVVNESATDALMDIVNYCILLAAWLEDRKGKEVKQQFSENEEYEAKLKTLRNQH